MSDSEESKLYFDEDMDQADLRPFASGQAAVFSCRCPTKDSSNEDSAGMTGGSSHRFTGPLLRGRRDAGRAHPSLAATPS